MVDWPDLMPKIPADMEPSIVTPHAHEDEKHPPVWLIWKRHRYSRDGIPDFPVLDTVCLSEDSARYHIRAALESSGNLVYCERVPADHRFGSSLGEWQMQAHMALWKERLKRKDGD